MTENKEEIVKQFNPSKWHKMLSRRGHLQKFTYWIRRPLGALIRTIEISKFKAPLLSRLFTDNSLVNMGITFERIFSFLTHDTKKGPLLSFSKRPCYLLSNVDVELKNAFIKLHSGHFLSPFKSDRQFMSGMYIDELHALAITKDCNFFQGIYFVLPRQDFYFHFLIEFLPRIVEAKVAFVELKVITTVKQPKFVYEALEIVNIPVYETNELIVNLESVFVAEETIKMSAISSYNCLREIQISSEIILPNNIIEKASNLCLLLTRKNQPRFNENLEKEVFAHFMKFGFVVVDPREFSFAQQILLFRQAKIIIGFHGGAMSNMVFMREGSQIYEIYADGYDGFNPEFFKDLAAYGNHKYHTFSKAEHDNLQSIIEEIQRMIYGSC